MSTDDLPVDPTFASGPEQMDAAPVQPPTNEQILVEGIGEESTDDQIREYEQALMDAVLGMQLNGDEAKELAPPPTHSERVHQAAQDAETILSEVAEQTNVEAGEAMGIDPAAMPKMPRWQVEEGMYMGTEQWNEEWRERQERMRQALVRRYGPGESLMLAACADYRAWCASTDMIRPDGEIQTSWIHLAEYAESCSTFEKAPPHVVVYEWGGAKGARDEKEKDMKKIPPPTSVVGLSRYGTAVAVINETQLCTMVRTAEGGYDWVALTGYELPVAEWGRPVLQNIDRSVCCFMFKRPTSALEGAPIEVRVDLALIPFGSPGETEIMSATIDGVPPNIMHATANNMWLLMCDDMGRFAAWSVIDNTLRPEFAYLRIDLSAAKPSSLLPPNPVSPKGAPPLEEPERNSRAEDMPILSSYFDDMDGCRFVVSMLNGSCMRGVLPMPRSDPSRTVEDMRLRKILIGVVHPMGIDSAKTPAGQAPPQFPTREAALNMCVRTVLVGEDREDFIIVQASEHSISYRNHQASFIRSVDPGDVSRRAIWQGTDMSNPTNCVACQGTTVVAHSVTGEISIFSMLSNVSGKTALVSSINNANLPPVTAYYPSIYMRLSTVLVLMPNASIVVLEANLGMGGDTEARMVDAGSATVAGVKSMTDAEKAAVAIEEAYAQEMKAELEAQQIATEAAAAANTGTDEGPISSAAAAAGAPEQ